MAKEGAERILFDKGNYFPNRAIAFEILKTLQTTGYYEQYAENSFSTGPNSNR